jgi:hypothetical protein
VRASVGVEAHEDQDGADQRVLGVSECPDHDRERCGQPGEHQHEMNRPHPPRVGVNPGEETVDHGLRGSGSVRLGLVGEHDRDGHPHLAESVEDLPDQ